MSDRVALDGRSMHDECTCDQNGHEPIWHIRKAIWHLKHPFWIVMHATSAQTEEPCIIPHDSPKPLGKSVTTTNTLDANLLRCMATGASLSACLHFCNQTPTDWYSKKQATVETATYGSEFVVAKTATEQIMDIRLPMGRLLGLPRRCPD